MPHLLQVGIPDTFGLVICMADVVTYMRRFAAEFAYSAHDSRFLSTKLAQLILIGQKTLY
jgi:hypothetical protein